MFEQWGGAKQKLGVDLGVLLKRGNVANKPELVRVQEHNLSSLCVERTDIRLVRKLVCIGDAWSEFGR